MRKAFSNQRSLRCESLETRLALTVTLADLAAAGISQRVVDYIDTSTYEAQILSEETLANTLVGLNATQTTPAGAMVLDSVADLSQIAAGTVANPNVYVIRGDLTITDTIVVPSNVHIYVEDSIFKQGAFTAPGGVHSIENTGANADAIFRLNGSDNVKLIGVNNALLHSTPNLDPNSPHATAVFIGGGSSNVEVDGFEMAFVWNGVAAHPFNIHDVTITNNYIRDTLDRAVWSLGTTNLKAAHNFVENAGIDSFDWDAFTDDAIGYENVSIGAGRWAGFVEEGTEDSYFIRGLGIIADFGNPNRGFMLGWADNGTSEFFAGNNPNPADWTEHNYFIDNVIFTEGDVPQSGGDYFAKENAGKGPTYFWANRGFGAGQSTTFFFDAEWLNFLPTAGGRNNAVNAVQLLADLDAEFNADDGIVLSAPAMSVESGASVGTVVGVVSPLNADVVDVSFEIIAGNDGDAFAIDNSGVITVAGPVAFDLQSSYTLTVQATDGDRQGAAGVTVSVLAPFATVQTLFDHHFASPAFADAGDVRGQQGWVGQSGWAVEDAAGAGHATSSTTAFQGVTNNNAANADPGETLQLKFDFDIDVSQDTTSDQFRFGVTTLNSGGTFIPAIGNNGSDFVSGLVRYAADSDGLLFLAEETSGDSLTLTDEQVGIDRSAGDTQTDTLRVNWEATKTGAAGEWLVTLAVENVSQGVALGETTATVSDQAAYDASGLYAGVRGLSNASQSDFRIDRFAYRLVEPGTVIAGDYNADGAVDAADFTVWRSSLGETGQVLAADGDRDGAVTVSDYHVWKQNFGQVASPVSAVRPQGVAGSGAVQEADAAAPPAVATAFAAFDSVNRKTDGETAVAPALGSEARNDSSLLLLSIDNPPGNDSDPIELLRAAEEEADFDATDQVFGLEGAL